VRVAGAVYRKMSNCLKSTCESSVSTVSARTMRGINRVVALLQQPEVQVGFLTGAGVSVAAGIPDFRSPGGMYDTLQPNLLSATKLQRSILSQDPTYVVHKDLFYQNQFPYMELRRPFILGINDSKQAVWKPTKFHWFLRLCDDAKKLKMVYTQNIDGLDYKVRNAYKTCMLCHECQLVLCALCSVYVILSSQNCMHAKLSFVLYRVHVCCHLICVILFVFTSHIYIVI
jgi:NAD-dependent SIR2 family protein deacetylase